MASSSVGSAKVLVKIGSGEDSLFPVPHDTPLDSMDRMALLKALAKDDGFRVKLKDVALDDCKVFLLRRVAGKKPTAAEEVDTVALEEADTIGEALQSVRGSGGPPTAGKVFIRVRLPGARVAADVAPFQRLYDALLSAKPEPVPAGASGAALIKLPEGALWPQLGAEPLFVRSFYAGCVDGPLSGLDPSAKAPLRKFVVIGNAGIGKSAFGSYLLWRAVQARRTVVYVSDKVDDAFIFHGDGRVEVFEPDEFKQRTYSLRHLPSTVLIVDGIKPPVCAAFTVLITSPKRERYKEYLKMMDARRLTFPVFSRDEINDMRVTCFPALKEKEAGVWERYGKWGGIPRFVLAKTDDEEQDDLECAVNAVDLNHIGHLMDSSKVIDDSDVISHRLFHLKPAGETDKSFEYPAEMRSYRLVRLELGSPYIIEGVYTALQAKSTSRLHELLSGDLEANPALSKLFGDLFELAALPLLSAGGSFPCFNLRERKDGDVVLPACERIEFNKAAELGDFAAKLSEEQLAKTVFVPRGGNYTGLDAVLPGRRPVNFTINLQHDLKLQHATLTEGVVPALKALGLPTGSDIPFYWVLPRQRFDTACKGGIKALIKGPDDVMAEFSARVVQFALLVDFKWLQRK